MTISSACDEGSGVDGGCDVACCVHDSVRRDERWSLSDDATSDVSHSGTDLLGTPHHREPADRLQLVQSPARVTQTTAGHHRNLPHPAFNLVRRWTSHAEAKNVNLFFCRQLGYSKILRADSEDNFWRCGAWPTKEIVRFWWSSVILFLTRFYVL